MVETKSKSGPKQELEAVLRDGMLRARSGDSAAYARFLKQVSGLIRAYFLKSSGRKQPELAEDLVQEVLVSIHRKKHLYDEAQPILPWIYAIARYRMIDSVRGSARRVKLSEWPTDPDGRFEDLAIEEMNPETAVSEAQSSRGEVNEALQGITERQKEILYLAKVEEVPLADIASRFGMSVSAVKVTVHRILKAIRKRHPDG